MWAFTVKFLRGVCVATDSGQWDETEWPIEPARLFMALAAAHFETCSLDADDPATMSQRNALQWLEQQPPPQVFASEAETRTPVIVFVPVNDSARAAQLLADKRSRQPRHFPTSIPHQDEIHFVYNSKPEDSVFESLEQIAFEVSRLGHSSSLVQVWIQRDFQTPKESLLHQWSADDVGSRRFRVSSVGTLESLERNFNFSQINEYAEMESKVAASKGVAKKKLKAGLVERFPNGLPPSQRPSGSMTATYKKTGSKKLQAAQSVFDSDIMVLAFHEAPTIHLESTLQLAGAFRKRIHDAYPDRTSPEWLGGHQPNGKPSKDPHLAIVPLAFTGTKHADGHLMGLGLVFPRHISSRQRSVELRAIFERIENDEANENEPVGDWCVKLNLHNFRRLTEKDPRLQIHLVREQRLSPPRTLQPQSWTRSCTVWETVTPIVLDRFPKSDRQKNRQAWTDEVAATISQSCENIGLPAPVAVHIHHNAFVRGVPNSRPKGGGFPPMQIRNGSRYQIHARIEFDNFVEGPVLLGAGRFVGYGFCRPNTVLCKQSREGKS